MEDERSAVKPQKTPGRKLVPIAVTLAALVLALALPVLSWFAANKQLLSYAPVTSPEALYIGAGHRDAERGTFEDIRYLYFNGVNAGEAYSDHVFCVYGTAISGFNVQLAFTTNNQFEYELYVAKESETPSEGAVKYVVHDGSNDVYYYAVDDDVNGGEPVAGDYLNATEADGFVLADSSRHAAAYGDYTHVNRFAEAIYWQTEDPIAGHSTDDFVVYFILRVKTNGKTSNDRETDVLCISAKSTTIVD